MSGHLPNCPETPFFSVIVPTYNRAEKVRRAALSVLAQTCGDFELLIIDDGSIDETEATIVALSDARIHYHWAPNSGGPATPRNRGIESARGQWVCFLDADDLWYPEKLQTIRASIVADSAVDVICNDEYQRNVQTGTRVYLRAGPDCQHLYKEMLINGNRLSSSATVVRKSVIDQSGIRFNQTRNYFAVEDYDFSLQLARIKCRFRFVSTPLGEYLIDDDNISAEPVRNRHNLGVLLRDHVFKIQEFAPHRDRLWRRVSLRLKTYDIKVLLAKGRYVTAFFTALAIILRSPLASMAYGVALHARRRYHRQCSHT